MLARALNWLTSQNANGGWGGAPCAPSSVEETALAVQALSIARSDAFSPSVSRGVQWLILHTDQGRHSTVSPIGLFFAKLWYFEELYPLIFAAGALIAAKAALQG